MVATMKITGSNSLTPEESAILAGAVADFIDGFKGKYATAMARAVIHREMVETSCWNREYRQARDRHTGTNLSLIQQCGQIANTLGESGPGAPTADWLKQLAKDTTAAGDALTAFNLTFNYPHMEACQATEQAKRAPIEEVEKQQKEAPMFHPPEFFAAVRDIVATWPIAKWSSETGRITIE